MQKACFVISPIGESDSETRKRSDQVLRHVIKPAVAECGYKAVRADEIDKPGLITSQVIQHVVEDPLVVADLTERNPNVFYELALRHALRRPLIQIIQKGEAIPFDVAGTRTIYVDHRDLDSVDSARKEIIEQVRALEGDASSIETPISVSLDLQLLRQSERPEDRSLGDLLAAMSELRAIVGSIDGKLANGTTSILADLKRVTARVDALFDNARPLARSKIPPESLFLYYEDLDPAVGFLVICSPFRESLPWLFEVGRELYSEARKSRSSLPALIAELRHCVSIARRGSEGIDREVWRMLSEAESAIGFLRPNSVEQKLTRARPSK